MTKRSVNSFGLNMRSGSVQCTVTEKSAKLDSQEHNKRQQSSTASTATDWHSVT